MPSRVAIGRPRHFITASTISVASAVRTVHWISGGMSESASFTATWLKPQVTQSSTTTAIAAPSSGRLWLAGLSAIKDWLDGSARRRR